MSFKIGILGGSGSGKTTFIKLLTQRLDKSLVCVISQDDYYLSIEQQPTDANGIENFDLPASIDHKGLLSDIAELVAGRQIERKEYTFNNPEQEAKTIIFSPAPVLVVEGIFVMYHQALRQQFDLTIYIDAPEHIRLKRRILRDTKERGYSLEDVMYRFEYHVMPTHLRYIEAYRSDVDLVINSHEGFEKAIDMLCLYLQSKFGSHRLG